MNPFRINCFFAVLQSKMNF